MPERTVEINLDPKASASDQISDADRINNELVAAALAKAELKKKVAEIYSRGVTADRLHVDLPEDVVGQWVPNNVTDIHRLETLGFVLDDKYAKSRRLHDKGDNYSYVGDVVHMIAPKIVRDVIDEVKRERYQSIHGGKKKKEEKDFEAQQETLAGTGIGTIAGGGTVPVNTQAILDAIKNPGT